MRYHCKSDIVDIRSWQYHLHESDVLLTWGIRLFGGSNDASRRHDGHRFGREF
jgi:hypothetical protein